MMGEGGSSLTSIYAIRNKKCDQDSNQGGQLGQIILFPPSLFFFHLSVWILSGPNVLEMISLK